MAEAKGVLVVGELAGGDMGKITGELLGIGRRLADALGEELSILLIGDNIKTKAGSAFALGADNVYTADDPALAGYQPELYAGIVEEVCKTVTPNVLILGATPSGRDLAPRLAWRFKSGLSSDCVDLGIDPETRNMIATRPVYGGKAMAEVDCGTARPAMATVRPRSQEALQFNSSRTGELISVEMEFGQGVVRTRIVERTAAEVKGLRLEDARIVVGGGRGMGSAENWKALEALADDLRGAVAASRGACDAGYCNRSIQVGISSKRVAPELYLAVGISGASQHMSGVSFSKHIVCINRDAEEPIFKEAELGVVGRWEEVLPAFHRKVKELLSEAVEAG